VGLSLVSAEIIPRFPAPQPLIVNTGNGTTTPSAPPPPSGNQDNFEDKISIDPFIFEPSPPILVALTAAAPPNVVQTGSDVSDTIVGGERDIRVTVEVGLAGLVFVAGATGGVFSISTPNQGSGEVLLQ